MSFLLFIFGASIGSFLNVVSLRYDPDRFLFGGALFGRSRCPNCGKTLQWFELIPLVSFIIQRRRCRECRTKISFQYPIVEIITGLIFIFIPLRIFNFYIVHFAFYALSVLWVLVFLALLLIALIDLRLSIIPDELNIFLLAVGIIVIFVSQPGFTIAGGGSFLGSYAFLFGVRDSIWINHFLGALFSGVFFSGLISVTLGRGMGMGDLKLAVPLGLIFGWPDTMFIIGLGFVIGSLFGIHAMLSRGKTLRSYLPFGPFLVGSAAILFFFGHDLVRLYLSFFGL